MPLAPFQHYYLGSAAHKLGTGSMALSTVLVKGAWQDYALLIWLLQRHLP